VLALLPAPEAPGGRGALPQRRDTLKTAVELAGKGTGIHKWAAMEKTQVFPVKPLVSLVLITATVATILFVMPCFSTC
jgi:hypothetical protein